jgi:hypothetical protein
VKKDFCFTGRRKGTRNSSVSGSPFFPWPRRRRRRPSRRLNPSQADRWRQWASARRRRRRRPCGGTSTSARCLAAAATRTASPTTSSVLSPPRGTWAPSQSLPTEMLPASPRPSCRPSPPPASASPTSPPVKTSAPSLPSPHNRSTLLIRFPLPLTVDRKQRHKR